MTRRSRPKSARVPLTRERVLRAGLALADDGGIESLSMRKLGDALGVKAMSLYNHVANKDDLLDGILDLVVAEIEVPVSGGDWRAAMRRRAQSAHAVFLRHPWACTLITARTNPGPAMLRYVDATLRVLLEAGFSLETADHAWNAIDAHVYGFTLQQLNFPFERDAIPEAAASYLAHFPLDDYPHLAALTRHVIEAPYAGINHLEFGLDLILDGLEQLLDAG